MEISVLAFKNILQYVDMGWMGRVSPIAPIGSPTFQAGMQSQGQLPLFSIIASETSTYGTGVDRVVSRRVLGCTFPINLPSGNKRADLTPEMLRMLL